jgi:hypothetical protein
MSRIVGSGGGGGCFLGHTLVRTPGGQRRIDELQTGDQVLSFDDRGDLHEAKVLAVHVHNGEAVVRYRLWGGKALDATPNHWVLNQFNAFVEIGTLEGDDCLVDENGHLRPIVGEEPLGTGTVYNLTVEGHHTFIAGGIRVHNAGLGLGVAGAGGGSKQKQSKGGGGRVPIEERDNLDSTQYAHIVDLLGEGEIEGLVGGFQGIFINDTPLQNPNGTFNFNDVLVYTRNGTQNQPFIPLSSAIEDEKPVNISVQQGTPITRTITDATADAARITIAVPALQRITDEGDVLGTDVRLQIAVQYAGGGYTTVIDDTIAGRTGDLYQRDYLVGFTGPKPVDIRVTRITPNSTSSKLSNAFAWNSYTEITWAKLRYPNSALVAMRVNAEQFNAIPARSYRVRGLKIRVPNNASVDMGAYPGRISYSGLWNGAFGAARYTNDPAWVLWDLLTSKRYGFGDHINEAALDKWAFFAASQYCNELVPNGFGGVEPRFSCNVNIQTQEDAYKLINDLCSVFRAMPYWSTGALTISQDRPADPTYLFNQANVSPEGFTYSGSSQRIRPTVAVVSYLDLVARDIAYEAVEDQAAIAKYGVVKTEISAFACTSRGQAARIGEWLLYSEQYEGEVVSFKTSVDAGVMVRPGQIIEIADPVRSGERRGGRIMAATTTTITVDSIEGLGGGGTLAVILPNGTVQRRGVQSISGATFNLASALSQAPVPNSVWVYETLNIQASRWRMLAVEEQDQIEYAITAVAHNDSKYAFIERGAPLQVRDTTDLNEPPQPPSNVQAQEVLYERGGRAFSKIVISWRGVKGVSQYQVQWRRELTNWNTQTIARPDFEILDTEPGVYEVLIYSLNAALNPSGSPARLTFNAKGKTDPPENVTGVQLIPIDQASAILSWNRAIDLDVLLGGKVLIRHSAKLVDAKWQDSQSIVAAAAGGQTQKQVPLLEGTYFLKFEDDGGNRSSDPAAVVADLAAPQPRLLVQQFTEDQLNPPFPGAKTNMVYDSALDGLKLVNTLATGLYQFGTTLNLGGVFDVNLQRRFLTRSFLPNGLWDSKLDLIDTWPEIDEDNLDATNAKLYVRSTDTASGDTAWSNWREFVNAIVRGRRFQFRVEANSEEQDQNILIDELGAVIELQQRVEQSAVLTSSAGAYVVTFANAFYAAPSLGITGFNMVSGDYFAVSNVTRTGFTVTFRDSANAAVSRQFTYTAIGFGREII